MRKFITIILLMITSCYCYAQTSVTIYYPAGSTSENCVYSLEASRSSGATTCSIKCKKKPETPTSLEIPNTVMFGDTECTVTEIPSSAFSKNTNFVGDLYLPPTIKTIGSTAFSGCEGFTGSLVLPINLTSIGKNAFDGCNGFTSITIVDANYQPHAIDGMEGLTTAILLCDWDDLKKPIQKTLEGLNTIIQSGDSNTNVSPVTFSPAAGSYTSSQNVTLSCETYGAKIYYSTDGSKPTKENGQEYKGENITVNTNTTIKVIAYKDNYANTSQATYTIIKTVEAPTLSHKSGDYNNNIKIEISCATEGSKIYYTTDGTEPTSSSYEYTSPIDVNKNTNIKAIAYKDGLYSTIVEGMYSFHTATPEFSQGTTSFNGNLEISLNCTTVGATIYYTTNGTEPTTSSKRYIEPISISETTTVKAFAVKEGYENSTVATAAYTKTRPVLTPTLSPAGGTFSGSTSVTISCEEGATIYYTTDGTEPTKESALYKESIILSEPTSIKAIAYKTGMTESQVATGTYNFYLPAPTFSVVSGTYNTVQNVEINCTAEGAKIYYTTDGTEPTSSSTEYTTAVTIDKTKTIKAIAVKEGWENSSIAKAEYTLKVPAITYTPDPSNQFDESATVTLTCNGATIYYTIDSTDPTNASTLYTNSITVNKTTNIKAIAVRDGWENSDMIDLWYKKFITVGEPVFNPDNNDALDKTTAITITCTVPNQEDQVYTPTIYYTLDGSDPTTNGTKYTGPISISGPTTIKAYGMVNDHDNIANSPVITKKYDFKVALPTITAGGSFTSQQTVTIGCTTEGASIYYTTDGSNPTTSTTGTTIASGSSINITKNTTVKAIAVKEGWISSDVVEATYEFNVESPSITPSCTFEGGESITISLSCNTNGSTIHYTTDGSDPTPESAICNGKITLNETKTIKAIACKEGWNSSQIVSATYTEKEIVHTPVLSLLPGSYTSTQNNAITCTTEGATIYYTTDGTEPTTSSKTITSGNTIEITQTTTVKAFAYKEGMTKSSIISETYTFEVIEPTFNKTNGLYEEAQTIEISCATEGAKIYYTTDGSEPNDNSTPYNGPIEIEKTTTIKAIAYKDGWNPSHITTASYAFLETVATPTFSHSSGDYNKTINVVIYCETPNAIIRYTMDGSTPDIHNTIYNGESIEVSETTTVKAVAFKDGMKTSEIAVATYTYSSNTTNALLVFTGNNPNNPNKWYDPLNWNTGTIPSKNDRVLIVGDLVISSDEKIEIEYITNLKSSFYTKQGSITIKDGGQLIYNQSALENVKIEKEITGYGDKINDKTNWYLISTPIADNISNNYTNLITGNDVNVNGTPDYDLYLYDEATHYWINYKDNKFTNLSLGHGYLYANRNNVTITSVGIPNTNDINFILSAACPNTSDEPVLHDIDMKGFNLIGNPFTFNIGKGDGQAIPNTYLLESGYYTLSTTYGTWVTAQDSRPIGVGEGILVETVNDGNDGAILTISKTPYVATSKTRSASEETESLSIKVVNENYEDIAYVNFNNEKRGLRKIAHMNEDAQMVYVPANGVNYAIANMNTDVKEIPVSFEASTMGKYTISIDASKCNFEEIYLRDNFTGETVDIIYEDYAFVATSSDKAERFTLLITNNNANEDSDIINQNFAYIHNGEIIISDVEGSGNVYVYDIMGRPVLTRHANGNVNIPASSLTGGIYIISLIDDNGIKAQKIAINK